MQPNNVFALMVGIDKYQSPVPALEGCVNDMRAFADFVELRTRNKNIPLHMNILENQKATRFKIVQQFEQHLAQAGKDDMVVCYFSGHGSQEPAHTLFWPLEEDRKNETIVAYDSRQADGMDLADKELATLIDLVTKSGASVTVVMDCCNSGSGTRAMAVESTPARTRVRQTPDFTKTRTLDSYILPRDLISSRGAFHFDQPSTSKLVVPTPRHVALSATQPFQLAKETWLGGSPRGVFTYSLMEVLEKSVGEVSYMDVIRQVRSLVKQRTTNQSPQIYAPDPSDLDLAFLGGATTRGINYYYLSHHSSLGWQIDAGATHGIPSHARSDTRLAVYPPSVPDEDLSDPEKAIGEVSIKEVKPASSFVRPEGRLELDKTLSYRTRISEMDMEPLLVHVRGDDSHGVNTAIAALNEPGEPTMFLEATENPSQADYHIIAKNQQYVVIRSTDADDQPLIEQVDGYSPEQARTVTEYMVHIAKWERAFQMKDPGSRLATNAIQVDLLKEGSNDVIQPGPEGYVFETKPNASEDALPSFRVRLTNRSGEKLFVALAYLGSQFEIEPSLLAQGGLWLDPGAETFALNGRTFAVGISQAHHTLGRTEAIETFKTVFSTEELNLDPLRQKALKEPKVSSRSAQPESTRGLIFDNTQRGSNEAAWNAFETIVAVSVL